MQSYPLHTHNVVYFSFLIGSKRSVYVESYQWQIGLERILILPLAPCGFDTPYLSLPPLEIATMIPCTWGLSPAILQYRPSNLYPTDRKETVAILQKDTHTPLRICK